MAITYVNAGTRISSAGATSATPALPASRVTGNLLIAVCGTKNNATHSTATSGWVKLDQRNSGTGWTLSVFYRMVDGSETAPVITWTGSVANFAIEFQYSGNIDSTTPIGNFLGNNGTTSPHTNAGTTATRDTSQFIYLGAAAANTAYGATTSWTERQDTGSNTGATRQVVGTRNATLNNGQSSGSTSSTGAAAAWVMYQIELLEPIPAVNITVNPSRTDYSFQSFDLTVLTERNNSFTPNTQEFSFSFFEPTVLLATNALIEPSTTNFSFSFIDPQVITQRNITYDSELNSINIDFFHPTVLTERNNVFTPETEELSFSWISPDVLAQKNVSIFTDLQNLSFSSFDTEIVITVDDTQTDSTGNDLKESRELLRRRNKLKNDKILLEILKFWAKELY